MKNNFLKENWIKFVERQVARLRYGTVEITVHDSNITLIEISEKVRLGKASSEFQTYSDQNFGGNK